MNLPRRIMSFRTLVVVVGDHHATCHSDTFRVIYLAELVELFAIYPDFVADGLKRRHLVEQQVEIVPRDVAD